MLNITMLNTKYKESVKKVIFDLFFVQINCKFVRNIFGTLIWSNVRRKRTGVLKTRKKYLRQLPALEWCFVVRARRTGVVRIPHKLHIQSRIPQVYRSSAVNSPRHYSPLNRDRERQRKRREDEPSRTKRVRNVKIFQRNSGWPNQNYTVFKAKAYHWSR